MECLRCNKPMYKAKLVGNLEANIFLANKKKGLLESEKRSSISCFVCPECGHIELQADDPKGLQI